MKVLFVSNIYPPYEIGGYEMLCKEVAQGLAKRGHAIRILTSTLGVGEEKQDGHVYRLLRMESELDFYQVRQALTYPAARRRNLEHLRRQVEEFQPDIIFIWGMWGLSKAVAEEAERLCGSRVVYYLANPWPIEPNLHQAYWDQDSKRLTRRLFKRALRLLARVYLHKEWSRPALRFEHAPCCSAALRDQLIESGVPLKDAPVIYEGIDLRPYLKQPESRHVEDQDSVMRLVYVGILAQHKGVHTAIEAMQELTEAERERVRLTILGEGHPLYTEKLHGMVDELGLGDTVSFHERIPRPELPDLLGEHDVLLLTSVWEEPLARIMQEGLASGMVVIGSATGGTKETIVYDENGLLFEAEDATGLAGQIRTLLEDSEKRLELARRGRQTATDLFDIHRMVDDLEEYLASVLAKAT